MRTVPFIVIVVLPLLTACASLKINAPVDDNSTLLVLPFKLDHSAERRSYGFSFAYEIVSSDAGVEPYRAVFKLPVADGMLIVDSLPPGDYRVKKLITIPVGTGSREFDPRPEPRNDALTLKAGQITIFSKSLNIAIFNRIPGRGQSTTYSTSIGKPSPAQTVQIEKRLRSLPNFDKWTLAETSDWAPPQLQGKWFLSWTPAREYLPATEVYCYASVSSITVAGATFSGRGSDKKHGRYGIIGTINRAGSIEGNFMHGKREVGSFWGRVDDGWLAGRYLDDDSCSGDWRFSRDPAQLAAQQDVAVAKLAIESLGAGLEPVPESSVTKSTSAGSDALVDPAPRVGGNQIAGRYSSRITSTSFYIFKSRYRDIEITLERDGNKITGYDDAGIVKLSGIIEGDTIKYELEPGVVTGFYQVTGEWTLDPQRKSLQGYWRDSRGDGPGQWDLLKIE